MEDIAKLAQVSKSAVSLALGGKPGISEETREKIVRIAREHGYTLRKKAQPADRSGKSLLFLVFSNSGIVLENYYQQPFFRELIHYIEERCRLRGYSLAFSSVDMGAFEEEIRLVAEDHPSSGVILLGTNLDRGSIERIAGIWPDLVVLDTCFDTLPVHFVQINNVMGAYQAGHYLCGIGHRDIGCVAADGRIHNFEERRKGFLAALREHGVDVPGERIFYAPPAVLSSQEALRRQLEHCLQTEGRLPTALFCECDYLAISTIKTLGELGIRIPEDVSVVGFDNINESVIVSPELTTVHVDKEKLAVMAVDLLIDSINDGQGAKIKASVDTKFVERLSCRAPAVLSGGMNES